MSVIARVVWRFKRTFKRSIEERPSLKMSLLIPICPLVVFRMVLQASIMASSVSVVVGSNASSL